MPMSLLDCSGRSHTRSPKRHGSPSFSKGKNQCPTPNEDMAGPSPDMVNSHYLPLYPFNSIDSCLSFVCTVLKANG
ncbi:hypothetical protein Hanom_Chr03g00192141 [Helianthus anomalus]